MISRSELSYGRRSNNRLALVEELGIEGARALLESFYYAFNHRDMAVFRTLWADHGLIQLNNPLGGILRGREAIEALYRKLFSGTVNVWVEFSDIVEFSVREMVVFAGRETGELEAHGNSLPLSIRATRVVQWLEEGVGWRQTHHHGSIDDPELLAEYRRAVAGQ